MFVCISAWARFFEFLHVASAKCSKGRSAACQDLILQILFSLCIAYIKTLNLLYIKKNYYNEMTATKIQ